LYHGYGNLPFTVLHLIPICLAGLGISCVISDLINPGITIVIPISDPNSTLSHTCYTLLYLRINIVKTEWLLIEVTDTYLKDVDGKSYIMEA
jgi:hypothetical protein